MSRAFCGWGLLLIVTLFESSTALGREAVSDKGYASRALENFGNSFGSSVRGGVLLGEIKTKTTDSNETDQRYLGSLEVQSSLSPASSVSWRTALSAKYEDALRQDSISLQRKIKQRSSALVGGSDVSFVASTQVEVSLGLGAVYLPRTKKEVELEKLTSTTKYSSGALIYPRLGLIKRTQSFAAGLFYSFQKEGSIAYNRVTGTEVDNGEEKFIVPATLEAALKLTPGQGLILGANFSYVQLGASTEKTEERAPIHRDYFRAEFLADLEVASNILSLELTHRTLSYQDQSFMSMQNIPFTTMGVGGAVGDKNLRIKAELIAGYGQDSQSTPELNAEFQLFTIEAVAGVKLTL